MAVSSLNQRRWRNFKQNRRAWWSLWIFLLLFGLSLFAEFLANNKPVLVSYRGEWRMPILTFYSETSYGGESKTVANYTDEVVICLIKSGGLLDPCIDDPEDVIAQSATGFVDGEPIEPGWILFAPVRYTYKNHDRVSGQPAPAPPSARHYLGTDDQNRDVLARVIYGFRISVAFALVVTFFSSVIGIAAGAIQGYFGGLLDLLFQRIIEIWAATPMLYVIIILAAIIPMNFTILTFLIIMFSWTALVGVVRAEFLRARNFEYVRAARALGVGDATIMFRHVLPNAMVATLTLLPFIITGAIGSLTGLDFLGYGLPPDYPSLGEIALQAKNNVTKPWLAFTAFTTLSVMLSLLVFIFEGVRDAFDPRKTFA